MGSTMNSSAKETTTKESVVENDIVVLPHDVILHVATYLDSISLRSLSETARQPNRVCRQMIQISLERARDERQVDFRCCSNSYRRLLSLDENFAQSLVSQFQQASVTLCWGKQKERGILSRLENSTFPILSSTTTGTNMMPAMPLPLLFFRARADFPMIASQLSSTALATTKKESQSVATCLIAPALLAFCFSAYQQENNSDTNNNGLTDVDKAGVGGNGSVHLVILLVLSTLVAWKRGAKGRPLHRGGNPSELNATTASDTNQQSETSKATTPSRSITSYLTGNSISLSSSVASASSSLSTSSARPANVSLCHTWSHLDRSGRGWLGLYNQLVIRPSRERLCGLVKAKRTSNWTNLSVLERQDIAMSLMEACRSDQEGLPVVRELVSTREVVDVDAFFVGMDGTETCALHAAAFHGCGQIIKFLCQGLDEESMQQRQQHEAPTLQVVHKDGGLCNVNMTDSNGWTALHFAAGANSVEAVRALVECGASLSVEAINGYTPLQWAIRLQNHLVADELRQQCTVQQRRR